MLHDLKYAWRSLSSRRSTTLVAVLCLALGVGANTALFGVVDALLLRPAAGVADPSSLIRVSVGSPELASIGAGRSATYPVYTEARERLRGLAEVAAYAPRHLTLGAGVEAERLDGVIATSNYFSVLGVRPHAGRFFDAQEDVPGTTPVAVLSHGAWQRRFGGDSDVVGRSLEVNGVVVTVVGIAPPGFAGVDLGAPEAWLPIGVAALAAFGGERQFTIRTYWLQMVARRVPGVTHAAVVHAASAAAWDVYAGLAPAPLHAEPLRPMFFAEQRGRNPVPLWTMGITLAVLLLACATVANLLLAQGVVREREIAVRLALGAPRSRILRQLLLESLLIAVAAAIAATALAMWIGGLLRTLPIPVIQRLVDVRVTAFAFGVALCTTLLFGLVPALRAARGDLDAVLRRGSRMAPGHHGLQHGLMVAQIALCFTLLTGAGLFVSSFRNAQRIDPGFDLHRLLEASVPLGAAPARERQAFVAHALDRVTRMPGVESATAGSLVPFYFYSRGSFHIPDGRTDDEQPRGVLINAVAPDYFRTLGITAAAGRLFNDGDRAGAPVVALVSETLAREQWDGGSPLGSCIQLVVPYGDACVRIAGIVNDVRFTDLRDEPNAILYLAAAQDPRDVGPATIFIRTSGDPAAAAGAIRSAIQSADSRMPYVQVEPLDARARPARLQWEVAATLFTAFGMLATFLAAIGLYMVVAFLVSLRTREIGIRMALGASRGAVLRLVLGRGARLTGLGVAVGMLLSLALGRIIASRLYGVSSTDPRTWAGAALLLACVALAATSLPARMAARVEPMTVLREE
jgi:putative ABC transport system permease protein